MVHKIDTKFITYEDQGAILEGFFAHPIDQKIKKPGILLCHAWRGRDEFVIEKAKEFASLGYNAFALDVYGKGKLGHNKEENSALMSPLMADRALLVSRLQAGLKAFAQQPSVDTKKIVAIGFCFGGLCALDLARSGANLVGAISVHGLLKPNEKIKNANIHAKILVLHGNDDPMVPQAQLDAFKKEMSDKKADWQIHIFGNTMHAFTDPNANDPNSGLQYNAVAAKRSWILIDNFFSDCFG